MALNNKERLLLLYACSSHKNFVKDIINESGTYLDWDELIKFAWRHKVIGNLAFSLECYELPKNVAAQLDEIRMKFKKRFRTVANEVYRLQKIFKSQGITIIFFKGIAAAWDFYNPVFSRALGDIDILVQPHDVTKVTGILHSQGYLQGEFVDKQFLEANSTLVDHYHNDLQHEVEFYRLNNSSDEEPLSIDVHTRFDTIYDQYKIDIYRIWERKRPIYKLGEEFYLLSLEDTLLHMCLHIYFHTQSIKDVVNNVDILLYRFVDVLLFLGKYSDKIDWTLLNTEVRTQSLRPPVEYALVTCKAIFPEINFTYEVNSSQEPEPIVDRWTFPGEILGYWRHKSDSRIFRDENANEALKAFYLYYLNHRDTEKGHKRRLN